MVVLGKTADSVVDYVNLNRVVSVTIPQNGEEII
jgi:hypothetical protein